MLDKCVDNFIGIVTRLCLFYLQNRFCFSVSDCTLPCHTSWKCMCMNRSGKLCMHAVKQGAVFLHGHVEELAESLST